MRSSDSKPHAAADSPTRVVVIGNGMVGSRFVEDLTARDHEQQFQITALGAEEYEPYNRVLLSEVVAGKVEVASLTLPAADHPRARIFRGSTAVAIDRSTRTVFTADGDAHRYDVVVLATGSTARIPAIWGLASSAGLPAGVHALRTLDDARDIAAATVNARKAVVIGAGVLGLEAACGLARRGLSVTLIHGSATLMDRQLDPDAGVVLAHGLTKIGVDYRTGATTEEFLTGDGRVSAVRLAGDGAKVGEQIDADLVVLACGTIPEVGIALGAGLSVDRGVIVDRNLASPDDESIFAIGDCAQPGGGASGLIAQGWEQSRRLAAYLAQSRRTTPEQQEQTSSARPSMALRIAMSYLSFTECDSRGTDVVRLKAAGLDVVTMGACGRSRTPNPTHRTLRLSDPFAGRHIEIIVDGDQLVGATCVGAGQIGADLIVAYTRRTPVPADPAHLLLRPVAATAAPATEPTLMPERTIVCRCNGVSKRDIVTSWRDGADTVGQVARATRATTGCGGCEDVVSGLVDWLVKSEPDRAGASSRRASDVGEDSVTTTKHSVTAGKPAVYRTEISAR